MIKLNLSNNPRPISPLIGTSTRRNCPCCEETLNFARLDTPSPKDKKRKGNIMNESISPMHRIINKYYSDGKFVKVVRRRPPTPLNLTNSSKFGSDKFISRFSKRNVKKLSVLYPLGRPKKVSSFIALEKPSRVNSQMKNMSINQEKFNEIWANQEKKMKRYGGLNKLQKILKRSLPPIEISAKNLQSIKFIR